MDLVKWHGQSHRLHRDLHKLLLAAAAVGLRAHPFGFRCISRPDHNDGGGGVQLFRYDVGKREMRWKGVVYPDLVAEALKRARHPLGVAGGRASV